MLLKFDIMLHNRTITLAQNEKYGITFISVYKMFINKFKGVMTFR